MQLGYIHTRPTSNTTQIHMLNGLEFKRYEKWMLQKHPSRYDGVWNKTGVPEWRSRSLLMWGSPAPLVKIKRAIEAWPCKAIQWAGLQKGKNSSTYVIILFLPKICSSVFCLLVSTFLAWLTYSLKNQIKPTEFLDIWSRISFIQCISTPIRYYGAQRLRQYHTCPKIILVIILLCIQYYDFCRRLTCVHIRLFL